MTQDCFARYLARSPISRTQPDSTTFIQREMRLDFWEKVYADLRPRVNELLDVCVYNTRDPAVRAEIDRLGESVLKMLQFPEEKSVEEPT